MLPVSIEELERGWRVLTEDERYRAKQLIQDAYLLVTAQLPHGGNQTDRAILSVVIRAMVKRAMSASEDIAPIRSETVGAGVYTRSVSYANPAGDLYLTSAEKKALGIGKARMSSIHPHIWQGDQCGSC